MHLSPAPNKRWALHRIVTIDDKGVLIGHYAQRKDVSKALSQIAYQPEFSR
jgi:hypothetical protein